MENSRREFIKKSALLGLSGMAGALIAKEHINRIETVTHHLSEEGKAFTLPSLAYAFDAMEPYIDKQTMEIHYGKHHKAYVDKLNGADLSTINLALSDGDKCRNIDANTPAVIRNNLGGHFNHSMFWELLNPNSKGAPNTPVLTLAEAIVNYYKTYDAFKKEFSETALKVFGSGWCWLIIDTNKRLKITTTSNQDNPLMKVASEQGRPILGLDVWEHAYYLKYQNKRADYINNWWNLVNWEKAENLYTQK